MFFASHFDAFKPTWVRSLLGLMMVGAIAACSEKAEPAKPTAAPEAAKPTEAAPAAAVTLTAKDFDPAGLTALVEGEGKDYRNIANPQPVQMAGKPEVIEFFWYGCPHCYAAEPVVKEWRKSMPAGVNFIRIPAQWQLNPAMVSHQKIAITLKALNKNDEFDSKVFNAIQEQGRGLADPAKITDFMVENGIDKATWEKEFNSFNTNSELAKADALFKAYQLTSVPAFVVNGKYLVQGTSAKTLQIVNKLIEQDKGKK